MKSKQKEQLYDLFKLLFESELTLSKFYGMCGKNWPDNEEFWRQLAKDESNHAQNLIRIEEIISVQAGKIDQGESFDPEKAKQFLDTVKHGLKYLQDKAISQEDALAVALQLENEAAEVNYTRIIVTNDPEINKILMEMDEETARHRQMVETAAKSMLQ